MSETQTVGPCLIRKLKWGATVPLGPSGYTPVNTLFQEACIYLSDIFCKTRY